MPSEDTQFKKGNAGGPGRPKGSRDRINKAFLDALANDFDKHGIAVIDQVREESAKDYLTIVSKLVPREIEQTTRHQFDDLSNEELMSKLRNLLDEDE